MKKSKFVAAAAAAILAVTLCTAPAFAEEAAGASPDYTLTAIEGTGNAIYHQEEMVACYPSELDVTKAGFATTNPLSYLVTATHELKPGTVIPNTAMSHISRNWSTISYDENDQPIVGEPAGLFDDDIDKVETTVIPTFDYSRLPGFGPFGFGYGLPQTGDSLHGAWMLFISIATMLALACGCLGVALSRRSREN